MAAKRKKNEIAEQAERYTRAYVLLASVIGFVSAAYNAHVIFDYLRTPELYQWLIFILPACLVNLIASAALVLLALAIQFTASVSTCKKYLSASFVMIVILGLPILGALINSPAQGLPYLIFLPLGWLCARLIMLIGQLR